jgi:two-component system nitrate/nitrite response regulator NarL
MKTLVGGATAIMLPSPQRTDRYEVILVDNTRLFREGLTGILHGSPFHVVAATADIDEAFVTANRAEDDPVDMVICSLDPQRGVEPQLATIRATRKRDPRTKIVLLMPACTPADLVAAVLCGVDGIILKDISGEAFRAALVLVMHGQHVLPLAVASEVFAACREFGDMTVWDAQAMPDRRAVVATHTRLVQPTAPLPGSEETIVCAGVFAAADAASLRDRTRPVVARNLGLSDRETQILQCLVEGCANKMIARRLDIAEATVKVHIKGLLRKINVSNRTQAAIWGLNQTMTARQGVADPALAALSLRTDHSIEAGMLMQQSIPSEIVAVMPSMAAAISSMPM